MVSKRLPSFKKLLLGLLIVILAARSVVSAGPYAAEIISYTEGTNAQIGYNDPGTVLGAPSFSVPAWPSGDQDVTIFASAWTTEQIVSIGAGGSLVVKFDHQVLDDPLNPFGIDFLIFGNSMFWDSDWPNGLADGIPSEPAMISVSQDGFNWFDISDIFADDLFPTQAYTDTSTAQGADGSILSDFTKPVDPAIVWDGKVYAEILALYDGSGGGTGIDISKTGLGWIQYVKVFQDLTDTWSAEIDAFADVSAVPEPTTIVLLSIGGLLLGIRRA
ncbi:MAG: PEP-CTERM sorting domain-containing protein [Sedimentisphaerales bacterium]|nr:PEP-CTERM sorting domain-containing protein [Sedimentisphaerales bacterium]